MNKSIWKTLTLFVTLLGFTSSAMAQNIMKQNTDIFPAPEKGYKKLIIEVPHSSKDENKKIEFSVGKWMEVDACNYFNLMGEITQKDLSGWGYNYYVFHTKGDVVSTQIGCLDNKKRNLFVTATPTIVNYNGKLPIVIYVPEGYDVHFKIYKAEEDTYIAAEESKPVHNKK